MNVTLTINVNAPELTEAIKSLAGAISTVGQLKFDFDQSGQAPVKTKAAPRSKTIPEAKKEEVTEPTTTTTENPDPKTEETTGDTTGNAPVPTVVDLRAKAQEKGITVEGKTAIKGLLDKFGSKSISDLPEDKRIDFMSALEAL